jgi:signal transduction histidine kinase/CheY-like chemotaxis protein
MRGSFIDRMLLPTIVGLSTFVFALILLQRLLTQQNADIQSATQTHALFVKNKLEAELEARILPLELLGELWQVRVPHEDPDMDVEFAATLVRSRYPVYQAIEWVDPSYRLRWVLPEDMRKSESSSLVSDASRRNALEAADASGRVTFARPVKLQHGGRALLVCVPVYSEEKLGGFLIGEIRHQELIDSILGDATQDYWISLYDGDEQIYGPAGAKPPRKDALVEEDIQFRQLPWRAQIWPKSETGQSFLPEITFGGGIVLAFLLAFSVYLAETAQFQAKQVIAANKELRKEIAGREQAEEALRNARTVEAVGRLAGGVAHDFNNLLTIIRGHAALSLHRLSHLNPDNPLRQMLNEIVKTTDRASSLTRQLLAFGRKQVLQPKVLDLNALVSQVARLLPPVLGEDITLTLDLDPDLGRAKVDAAQMERAIMNFVFNARDAMPSGGQLSIQTSNSALDDSFAIQHPGMQPGPHVMLAVKDTGHGMDEETQSHIFEPFFTTKDRTKGTGLGLATVHGAMSQSGGCVTVLSKIGEGTTIRIYLPRVEEAIDPVEVPEARPASLDGSETILVVEDDDAVRRMTLEFLKIKGYSVLEARNAADAIQFVGNYSGSIDLVLTDVLMPGIKGGELGERLAQLRTGIRVLYMSAYTEDAVMSYEMLGPGMAFIEKPFSPDDLAKKVRELLATQGGGRGPQVLRQQGASGS